MVGLNFGLSRLDVSTMDGEHQPVGRLTTLRHVDAETRSDEAVGAL